MVSVYFHIPFCTRKCDYCHFYVIPNKEAYQKQLMAGLNLEIQRVSPHLKHKKIVSVYFGGGTPALLGPERIGSLLSHFDAAEVTLEANPEDVTPELMQAYQKVGINRVSLGVQSFDEALLKQLSRGHSAQKAIDAIHITKEAGISNISIDLMYELPGQTVQMWQETLKQAAKLPITHLSLYNLTFEPQTVFYKKRSALQQILPSPDESKDMYQMAVKLLNEAGLKQYEISAFARDGLISQHNVGYWTARPFLGLGPSAFSFWEGKRFRNICNLNKYHRALLEGKSAIDYTEELNPEAKIREQMVIRLRLLEGINLEEFDVDEKPIEKLIQDGLLKREGSALSLTQKGTLFYDTVAADLI